MDYSCVLAFGVTLEVFTPCLGVLHVMWSAWCVDDPWLSYDGHAHVEVACFWIFYGCICVFFP
jgi:hypothetical protein